MTWTLVIRWIAVAGMIWAQDPPKDPASLGFVELTAPAPIRERAYSDLPPAPGSDDETWFLAERKRIDGHYGTVDEYTKDLGTSAVVSSLRRATQALQSSPTFDTPNGARMRANLASELETLGSEVEALVGKAAVPPEFGARLDPTSSVTPPIKSDVIYFAGTPRQVIFRTTIPDGGGERNAYFATPEQALEFREVAGRIFAVAAKVRGRILRELSLRLGELNKSWDNYLVNGYSQFPWESYVNGHLTPLLFDKPSWYDPPQNQLVFMHPELGVLADFRSRSSANSQTALFVNAIGYIHYFGEDRGWFLGASAAASLSGDDVGLGIGPMLHFGNSARGSQLPNLSLGVLWHEPQDDRDGFLIAVSIDLWRVFDKTGPEGLFRSAIPGLSR